MIKYCSMCLLDLHASISPAETWQSSAGVFMQEAAAALLI